MAKRKKRWLKLRARTIGGVRKYEIEPGQWVTRQRVSQIRHGLKPRERVAHLVSRRHLEATLMTNRLLTALLISVREVARRWSLTEHARSLSRLGLSSRDIGFALGTTEATINASLTRVRKQGRRIDEASNDVAGQERSGPNQLNRENGQPGRIADEV